MTERTFNEQELAEWCLAIKGYVCRSTPPEILAHIDDAINTSLKRKNVKALQRIAKDLADWARTLSTDLQKEMNADLRARFGKSLDDVGDEDWKALRRVLARGKIDSEEEYELVAKRVDEIYANDSAREELEKLNTLLREHDQHAVR